MLKLQKLDGRHYGHVWFSHRVEIKTKGGYQQKYQDLNKIRTWLWEQYGPSCEVDYVATCFPPVVTQSSDVSSVFSTADVPVKWAWRLVSNTDRVFVYLKDDALTHFQLKWM